MYFSLWTCSSTVWLCTFLCWRIKTHYKSHSKTQNFVCMKPVFCKFSFVCRIICWCLCDIPKHFITFHKLFSSWFFYVHGVWETSFFIPLEYCTYGMVAFVLAVKSVWLLVCYCLSQWITVSYPTAHVCFTVASVWLSVYVLKFNFMLSNYVVGY